MTRLHTDLSRVPVSVAPSPATSGTSLGVTDANAAYLPDTYPYWAVLVPTGAAPTRSNSEIVKVTGGSSSGGTTTLTIVRAQGIPVTTAQTVTTSFDIYDANSSEANIGLNSLIINETPSGTVNGSNAAFDTASTYIAGSIQVYRDGQLMKGGGEDYTETDSNTITFTTAPATGSVLLVTYQHVVSTTGNADTLDGYHANATPTANNIPVLDANAKLPNSILAAEAWSSWNPTSTGITVGNGSIAAYYKQIGKIVTFSYRFTFGSTSSITGNINVTVPVGESSNASYTPVGVMIQDSGTGYLIGQGVIISGAFWIYATNTGSSYGSGSSFSSTVPITWATGDTLTISGTYEAA